MPDTPPTGEPTDEPAATEQEAGGAEASDPQFGDTGPDAAPAANEPAVEPGVPAPQAPMAPESLEVPGAPTGRGQRRITRETHTTTTRSHSETTTHETSTTVEDVAVAPPVYAAPASEHPRPVG